MKALVTGGTGFVGKHLVKALTEKGTYVRMLVRNSSDTNESKKLGVELVHGDVTDRHSLEGIAKDINIVYHLAAVGHVSAISKEAYKRFFEVNVNGTKYLAEECSNKKIDKFIHFSSTAAMGLIKRSLVDETIPCQPSTPYQISKYESERVALRYWKQRELAVVVLRPCMIYGVGGTGEFLKICRLIKKGAFPKVGRGKNLTPLVHVDDVVQAAILSGEHGEPGETYLVTSSKSFDLDEIRRLIAKYLEVDKPHPYVPYVVARTVAYLCELTARACKLTPMVTVKNIESTVTDRVFNITKAKEKLRYVPQVDLDYGIGETISWFKSNGYV
jgi:nucleoside-diphosphate-sugar epimerase